MSELAASLERIVTALEAAGVSATTDARNLNPPCAWVTVADVTTPTLCGGYQVRAAVCLIAGDFGSGQSLGALGELLDKAAEVVTFDEPVKPMTVTPPGVGVALPALVITTTT
ncbi:hypothetical protein PBI_JEANIE_9 [Gordonia phage Jeanie]|uniref:Uncharacterized protein n=2 Tax=root TaxID=1 RepID=A0A166YGT9_9CAUD|nr:hypothetical protein [Gordonia neofelifaecis]YP_009274021.1 hypothetical protein BH764_gp09 [Gordonia phage McGonagall]ANA87587.1 hypothetical protein MCGONAGALL_9 [Gordonia phage McGonagall]ANA87614.1 hypothetical protein PBI_JEANIE_9 [Gordonia phage Jeanie]EGD53216.1 hypothetical protein SCNU_20052 [Gordonia neofelifaecis NRRL B-59395]